MRPWSDSKKQTLRHLAAARFFLPVLLKPCDGYDAELQYIQFLHHAEWGLALDVIADIGVVNAGYAEEQLFWLELAAAANLMNRDDAAAYYRAAAERVESNPTFQRTASPPLN